MCYQSAKSGDRTPAPGPDSGRNEHESPAISIIMNVFNGGNYVKEAVDSVLSQSFTDWELVFWDDQSTDDTAEIFKRYDDRRFRYFYAPEWAPLGRARRLAIEKARGEWLAFLDHDDIWTPDKLDTQMALLAEPGAERLALIYGRALDLRSNGSVHVHDPSHEYSRLPEGDILVDLLTDSCFIAQSSVLIRRSAYDEVGGFTDKFHCTPDYHLYLSLSQRYEARAVQFPCCWYRSHNLTISRTRRKDAFREVIEILDSWEHVAGRRSSKRLRAILETLLGSEEILEGRLLSGVARILKRGSLPWLFSQPFVRVWRKCRRLIRPSPWNRPPQQV